MVTAENAERVRALTMGAELDAIVSSRPEDVAYLIPCQAFCYRPLTEGRMAEIVLLTPPDGPRLFTMSAYLDYYASIGISAQALSDLSPALKRACGRARPRIAVPSDCPAALHAWVESTLDVRPLDVDPFVDARLTKTAGEVELIRAACRLAEQGMDEMLDACVAGAAECEVAAVGEAAMRRGGADALCFSTVVVGGPELGVMREFTGTRVLENGDWVMIDGGCTRDGYNAEFARGLQIGSSDELFIAAYRAVHEAQRTAIGAIRAGVSVGEIDQIARDVISDAGFGDHCYEHITGHGIGTGVWEGPIIERDATERLRSGEVFSIEPGIFIRGTGGIRIEDLVVANHDGAEVITPPASLPA